MKICIISDLHLPYSKNSVQYKAFDKYLSDAVKNRVDMIICPGDFTANGNIEATKYFLAKINETGIPYAVTTGNSDLRSKETRDEILSLACPCLSSKIITLNDYDRNISEAEFVALDRANNGALVTMHHPYTVLHSPSKEKFAVWRQKYPDTIVMNAHLHKYEIKGNNISLPCADPDKNIGDEPWVMIYDTENGSILKNHFECPMPDFFKDYIGISCYKPFEDIPYARLHNLKHIELRPSAVSEDRERIKSELELWRKECGEILSLHAPDIIPDENGIVNKDKWKDFTEFAHDVDAQRITLHVPKCSLKNYPFFKPLMLEFLAQRFEELPDNCIIGIENMHMTAKDSPDETRRFGYTPDEVKDFMTAVKAITNKQVGINLDIGHARNNAPYSERFTLGAWYAEVGKLTVSYHIHQVTSENGVFTNHAPLTSSYGKLISLASFYRGLSDGTLNIAPIIFEIRDEKYKESIEWLENK